MIRRSSQAPRRAHLLGVLVFAPFVAVAVTAVAVPGTARAEEPLATPDRVRAAEEEYDAGRRAFLADQFEAAASHFENAFRDAPRSQVLRSAIRSRQKAGQLARAATLADLALRRYTADAQTRELANEVLGTARNRLHELRVTCTLECGLTADGKVASIDDARLFSVYLEPGPHTLTFGFSEGRGVQRSVVGRAGATEEMHVEPPPLKVAAAPVVSPGAPGPAGNPTTDGGVGPRGSSGLPPSVFYVGVGLTLAGAAATVISGVATVNSPGKDAVRTGCAGQGTECPLYQSGLAGETRTNVGLGVTVGLATLTGVVGLFLTDWGKRGPAAAALPSPGKAGTTLAVGWQSATISGQF